MKLKCLVFLSFVVASQAATVRHRQREIPVQVIYEEARAEGSPLVQKNVEAFNTIPEKIEAETQADTVSISENTVAGEKSVGGDVNAIKYFSRIKNLDAKVQLSSEEQAQSIKHLPFSDAVEAQPQAVDGGLKNAADAVCSDAEIAQKAFKEGETSKEIEPLKVAEPSEKSMLAEEAVLLETPKYAGDVKPSEGAEASEQAKPALAESEDAVTQQPQTEGDVEQEEEGEKAETGEGESSVSSLTDLSAIIEKAQEIVSTGIQELRERFKEAEKHDLGAWNYLEKSIEQLFITEKEKVNVGQGRQGPILQNPEVPAAVETEIGKQNASPGGNQTGNKVEEQETNRAQNQEQNQAQGSVPNRVENQAPNVAVANQAQAPVESQKQDQSQPPNQNQNQNVIQNIINGFQNITNNFIQNLQQRPGGNGTQEEGQPGGGSFINYFTGGFQQILNNINNLGGGGNQPGGGNGTQADAGSTTQRPNIVSNFVSSFQQFIRPPGTPQGNQSDTPATGGGNNQQGPGGFFQGAINQFGQAVNNIFQGGSRPPGQQGDTGSTPAPAPGPIQAFQNISNQIISNLNQFNPFAPSTQPPAAAGDDASTQRPTFVQNVGQVIQGFNPFRPPQQGGAPSSNPIVAGIQNATNQFQQVVGNQSFGNPVENIQNAIGGGQNPIQSIQNAVSGQNPPEDAANNDGNRVQGASSNQNLNADHAPDSNQAAASNQGADSNQIPNANQVANGDGAGQTLRTSGLVEKDSEEAVEPALQQPTAQPAQTSEPQQEIERVEKVEESEEKKEAAEQAPEVMQAVE